MRRIGRFKKSLAIWILLTAVYAAGWAEQITSDQAKNVAMNWMSSAAGSNGLLLSIQSETTEEVAGIPVFYIVNFQPTGYTIVAADNRLSPILAYSYESQFVLKDRPRGFDVWIEGLKRAVLAIIEGRAACPVKGPELWEELDVDPQLFDSMVLSRNMISSLAGKSVPPLLATKWGQGQFYNELYPTDPEGPGGHAEVPSGATARSWSPVSKQALRKPASTMSMSGGSHFP